MLFDCVDTLQYNGYCLGLTILLPLWVVSSLFSALIA